MSSGLPEEPGYLIDVWQTEHGLPENIVNAIAQTRDGYLWCGTTHGLARFDGVRFKVFNGRNTPELGSGRIRQLFVDRGGALWITVFEGRLVRLKDGLFTAYLPPPRETTARTMIRVAEDESGALWLTVEDGAVFRFARGEFTLASLEWQQGVRTVFQVYGDPGDRPWVTTASYLARLEKGKPVPVLQGQPWQYEFLCPSRSGGWWIQTAGRARLWREGEWVADAGPWVRPERRVECCLEDRDGRLWVASLGKGVFCYSTNGPVRQLTVKDGLGSDLVRGLLEDDEGNLWAGTRPGGLNRIRPALFKSYGRKEGLASDLVTAVCEGPGGDIWIGTDGDGVNRLKGDHVDHFDKEQGLDGRYVRTLLFDREGTLWLGAWPGGLFRFEQDHFVGVRDFPGRDMGLASLLEDAKGGLWLGQRTLNRLVRLDHGTATAVELPNPTPALDVTTMAEDRAGNLWVGTDGNGLFRWKAGQCRRFTRQDGLPSDTIRALLAEPDGALWIGTVDGGLCRFKGGRFVSCTTRDGLVDDVINFIVDDGRGYFWCTCFQGVFRVSKAELAEFAEGKRPRVQCVAYGRSDGLPALECPGGFQPAGCRARDGRLWFPTIKGLVVVDPDKVPTNSIVPPVLLEEVVVDGRTLDSGRWRQGDAESYASSVNSASATGLDSPVSPGKTPSPAMDMPVSLKIGPGHRRYEFHYTGLSFTSPDRVRFRYMLEGLDKDWVPAGTERAAVYGYLSPGDYRFRVTACNQTGAWNETGATLAFTVLPHFWQTWWFLGAAIVGAAGTVGGTVFYAGRRRWQRRLERLEMQLSVERERTRIAQDIHDGVGANLTEIAWLAEVAEKEAIHPEEVRAQARKISGTARETVQSFDEIVWAVLPQNDSLTSLVEYLGRRVEELFENTSIRCWLTAPRELPPVTVPAEVRHSFYLACKEALHNVVRHSQATEVRVRVTVGDSTLRVDIEDNGRGFDPAAARPGGNGLRNMRRRFEKLGGGFELHTRPAHGTRVAMSIPLKAAARAVTTG